MIDHRPIFAIHRLAPAGLSVRQIAQTLGRSRPTTSTYLADPTPPRSRRPRPRQLDLFQDTITCMVEIAPKVSAVVLRQRLAEQGCTGGRTMVRQSLTRVRPAAAQKRAFSRCESAPGVQCQIDWGHVGALAYGSTTRTLSCLAVIACHSRLLSLEFPHAQRQDPRHRCLLNALHFFQGPPQELVHDHMLTAVRERHGPLVRFNAHFLAFLRPFHLTPIACNVAQPQDKGQVEKGALHDIRHTFWPRRTFQDLPDLQAQANQWRDQVATVRVHTTTGEPPLQRFAPKAMRPLPAVFPDGRDTALAKGHTDFAMRFDGHTSPVPPWLLGTSLTVQADHHHLTCDCKDKAVATHLRCWQRPQRLELPQHREAAHKHHRRHWYSQDVATCIALGETATGSLEHLATTNEPLPKQVQKLLALTDDEGAQALVDAMQRAPLPQAYGAHDIDNILSQEMPPQRPPPPVRLKQSHRNPIRLEEPALAAYEACVIQRKRV
jgi:transposase